MIIKTNNLFKQQFLMHLDKVLWKIIILKSSCYIVVGETYNIHNYDYIPN
jgi:hypothetical protein